jgi:hypothetical protein
MSKENEVRNAISDIYTQLRIIDDSLKDLYKRVMELEQNVKPKEPDWWENIPEHGVLCWVSDIDESTRSIIDRITVKNKNGWRYITPLTNEEIERFKR